MYEQMSEIIAAERRWRMDWVSEHAWKCEQARPAKRSMRGGIARAFRLVAERIAPAAETAKVGPAVQR